MIIQKVNTELNRIEAWQVLVDDLTVWFKKPFTEFQDKAYNNRLPGTTHTLVREFNKKESKVRFWTCEIDEFRNRHISLSFKWGDSGTSTGIDFDRTDIVRMIRRGMHVVRIPNPTCWTCSRRESDWATWSRLGEGREYDPAHHWERNGIRYCNSWWYCNGCLAKARARGEKDMDVVLPDSNDLRRAGLLARLRESPIRTAAGVAQARSLVSRRRTMLRFLHDRRKFWTAQHRKARRSRAKLAQLCAGRAIPSEVQWVMDQFSSWAKEAVKELRENEHEIERWKSSAA